MTSHPVRWFLVLGCLTAVLPLGCGQAAKPPEEEGPPTAPVKAEEPKKQQLGEWLDVLGTSQPLPSRAARISAAVEGRVLWVLGPDKGPSLAEGQPVKGGEVIVQLDDRVLRANRNKAEAAQAELAEQQKQADLAVELAQIEVKRLETLGKNNVSSAQLPLVSRIELDKARIALKDAESRQRGVGARKDAGKAELAAIDEQLSLYQLKCPIDKGVLGTVQVVPGQTLVVGTVVAEVVDLDEIDLLCYVPPHLVGRLKLDLPARLANDDKAPAGTVKYIAAQARPDTGNFLVKLRFPNSEHRLRANRIVPAQIQTQQTKDCLTIPLEALHEDQEPPGVVVVYDVKTEKKEDKEEKLGKARKLQAKIGLRGPKAVEILGLTDPETKEEVPLEGLWFVTEGAHGLENKDVVKLEEPEHKEEK